MSAIPSGGSENAGYDGQSLLSEGRGERERDLMFRYNSLGAQKHFVNVSFVWSGHDTPRETLGRVPRVILGSEPVKVWVSLPHVDRNLVSD